MGLGWMAWTWPTAGFFIFIFLCIAAMAVWERVDPQSGPRHGIFGLDTTRGDRLFISLLGSAFIFMAWLGFVGTPLWIPLGLAIAWGVFVFRWV